MLITFTEGRKLRIERQQAGGGFETVYETAEQLVAMNRLAAGARQQGDLYHSRINAEQEEVGAQLGGPRAAAGARRQARPPAAAHAAATLRVVRRA